jgi:outer membrane biosynthesis protein TonB
MAPRRSRRNRLVVGLAGTSTVDLRAARTHIDAFIEAQEQKILWVFPEGMPGKSLTEVVDDLYEEGVTYEVVAADDSDSPLLTNAAAVLSPEGDETLPGTLIDRLAEAEDAALIMLLDEEEDADLDLLDLADQAKIKIYDLAETGCSEVVYTDLDNDVDEALAVEEPEKAEEPQEGVEEPEPAPEPEKPAEENSAPSEDIPTMEELLDLTRAKLLDLAEERGLEIRQGTHRKTIAREILTTYAEAPAAPEPAPKPERAPEAEPEKAPEPEVDPESAPEVVPEIAPDVPVGTPEFTWEIPVATTGAASAGVTESLIHTLAGIAIDKGTKEAESFFQMLRRNKIV